MDKKRELERKTAPPDGIFGISSSGLLGPVKLVVVEGPDEGQELALDSTAVVGSSPEGPDLVLNDPAVSRKHAMFMRVAGGVVVKDQGSLNGVYLGGMRVQEAEVPPGAMVHMGDSALAVRPRWHVREVKPSPHGNFGQLIGESLAMREQFAMMERIAPTDLTVLVEGESGTGKELAARSLHDASTRVGKPYVVFDCGSVPRDLAESELFGHKKGSFSGAVADRRGLFAQADGGTIVLDEIGELPLELQPKLLRVLETGEVRPVGTDRLRKVDVRVVAATNRVLSAEVTRGTFRRDLLYRLEVVRIQLPPLRQRPEDIPPLVEHFLKGKLPDGDRVDGPNRDRLLAYSWPGNVRELRNALVRAAALAQRPGEPPAPFAELVFNLGPSEPAEGAGAITFPGVSEPMPYKEAKEQLLAEFERAYVKALLERHSGNMSQSANEAEISRKHLYQLQKRIGK